MQDTGEPPQAEARARWKVGKGTPGCQLYSTGTSSDGSSAANQEMLMAVTAKILDAGRPALESQGRIFGWACSNSSLYLPCFDQVHWGYCSPLQPCCLLRKCSALTCPWEEEIGVRSEAESTKQPTALTIFHPAVQGLVDTIAWLQWGLCFQDSLRTLPTDGPRKGPCKLSVKPKPHQDPEALRHLFSRSLHLAWDCLVLPQLGLCLLLSIICEYTHKWWNY